MTDSSPWTDAIDNITQKLLDGQKILVRALPRSGRSTMVNAVSKRLAELEGNDPIVVRYGDDQSPESVVSRIRETVSKVSAATLLIDDWGKILSGSPNVPWQPRLNSVCVDGPSAKAIGVLLTATPGENLSRSTACGSPLVDAVHEIRGLPIPLAGEIAAELRDEGVSSKSAEELVARFGGHRDLLRAARSGNSVPQARTATFQIASQLGHDGAARILDLGRRPKLHLARQSIDDFLVPAVYAPEPGRTALIPALPEAGLLGLLPGSGDSWPSERKPSADRLLTRLMGGQDAFWFDRYLYTALPELLELLDSVTSSAISGLTIRLLSGKPRAPFGSSDAARAVESFKQFHRRGVLVRWHQVDQNDIHPMHDRQLLFQSSIDGYHLPPADRIVGRVPPGNENDAYLARAPLGRMKSAWIRSSCWACVPDGLQH